MSTPEYLYVLDLAAAVVRNGPPQAPPDDLRWPDVLELLARHRLTLTLGPLIDAGALPDALAEELAGTLRALRVRHGWYLMELDRLLDALERSGCRTLVLKGGALNHTVYAGRAPRYVSDLDVLVQKHDLEDACATLDRLGFRAAMERRSPAYYETHHFHRILRNEAGVTVEVHWQLARPTDWVAFDIEGIFARSRSVATAGREIPMACEADQLLDTAFQSLGDGFWNLRRFIDAALLVEAGAADDPRLAAIARDSQLRSALWILLDVTRALFAVPVPDTLMCDLVPARMARTCLASLGPSRDPSRAVRVPDLHHLVRWLCAPSASAALRDMSRLALPSKLELAGERHRSDGLLGLPWRAYVMAERARTIARLLTLQLWRLAAWSPRAVARLAAKKKAGAEAPAS